MKKEEKLVKSRNRVIDHGEVFTSSKQVNDMLDLVEDEASRIDSRFLEPACGEGNFLVVILQKKLNSVHKQYSKNISDYEKYSIIALSSIYGVELLEDNTEICQARLFEIWNHEYKKHLKKEINSDVQKSAKYILEKNILCGDALTMQNNNGQPIIFSQWDLVFGDKLKRRDYRFDVLLKNESANSEESYQINLLDDHGVEWAVENGETVKIPKPLKEYPLTEYWKAYKYE